VRRRSVANIIEELRQLRDRYGFSSLVIHDDSVTQDVAWATEFCTAYKDQGFTQPFFAQSRADFICDQEPTFALLAGAGLKAVSIGFESGSDRVLRQILHKGVTVEQNLRAATICRRYGVKIFANYMLGIPGETKDEVRETVRMMRMIHPEHQSLSFFTPLPGSDLYATCRDQGLLLDSANVVLDRGILSPKIRGVDYEFLKHAAGEAQDLPWLKRVLRRASRTPLGMTMKRMISSVPLGAAFLVRLRRLLRASK
jgi:anaerobic magnesium-protoporphyrin IX monomethyl ester cyclase